MDTFFIFFDFDNNLIVAHNEPKALDRVPYDRIARRYSKKPVDAGLADIALSMLSGTVIYGDRTIEVQAI